MVRSQDYGAHWQLDQTLLDSYHDSKCRYHASPRLNASHPRSRCPTALAFLLENAHLMCGPHLRIMR
jgi:hypothetical protein